MTTQPEQQTTAPEVVAYRQASTGQASGWHYKGDWRRDSDAEEQALVTQPDALAYADARAARAVEQERARVVAWLRGQGGARTGEQYNERMNMAGRVYQAAALMIEAGEHERG